MARIVVAGYMVRHPLAGNMLAYFHYLLGLARLGHEVAYVEESGWPSSCYDPEAREWTDRPARGLAAVRALAAAHRLDIPIAYVDRVTGRVEGSGWDDVKDALRAADLLLNLGGVCWLPEFRLCRRRALVDMDPLFTQLGRFGSEALSEHHVHFSYGANVGAPSCSVPGGGVDWLPLAPPVVRELWPAEGGGDGAFTTVSNWSAYGSIAHEGERYGQKDEEFLRLLDLPQRTAQTLELALSGVDGASGERLRRAGWILRNGGEVSTEPRTYIRYVTRSRAELSVAKHAYVKTRSGWFSDRSVCYLAAARPVVLQDTGFTDWLPTGRGVLAFSSVDEAAACLEDVNGAYDSHRRAARDLADRVFAHDVVLPRLLAIACPTFA